LDLRYWLPHYCDVVDLEVDVSFQRSINPNANQQKNEEKANQRQLSLHKSLQLFMRILLPHSKNKRYDVTGRCKKRPAHAQGKWHGES